MKLNNHGWGLAEMLLLIALLLVFLLIAIFYIARLYNGFAKDNTSNNVEAAVNEYLYDKFGTYDAPYDIMLSLEKLKEETDLNIANNCVGYVLVKNVDGKTVIKNNITCD
ncbi:MAG: hypothetical protein J5892_00465 [Bacilli bacterium]|nr:hypothetical protein [Bacilli bacterium]